MLELSRQPSEQEMGIIMANFNISNGQKVGGFKF